MTERRRLRLESKKRKLGALAELILHKEIPSVPASKRPSVSDKEPEADGNMLAEPGSSPGGAWCQAGTAAMGLSGEGRTGIVPVSDASELKRELTDEEVVALKARIRARQKAAMMLPKLFLDMNAIADEYYKNQLNDGPRPADAALPPLFLMDVQHLLLFALMGKLSSYRPRWCQLLRVTKIPKVVLAVVDGLGSSSMAQYAEQGSFVGAQFDVKVELVSPHIYGAVSDDELFKVPLTGRKLCRKKAGQKKLVAHFVTEQPQQRNQPLPLATNGAASHDVGLVPACEPPYLQLPEVVPRTELLLNWSQLIQEGYPLGLVGRAEYAGFVYTKSRYSNVTDSSPMYAVDCEMCRTTVQKQELTRVSVVDEQLRCIYDTFVKPRNRITDYLTQYSGITKEILQDVTTRIEDVQREFQRILPSDAILIGQSLNNDLFALKMFHPYCIDTSVVFNLRGFRHCKTGLKKLMAHFLGKTIQDAGPQGHNSIEDARSAMELVLLKLRCGIDYGDAAVGGSLDPLAFIRQMDAEACAAARGIAGEPAAAEVTEQSAALAAASSIEQCSSANGAHSEAVSKELTQKRKARFLYRSLDVYDDFFELLGRCGKEAGIVASERVCRLHKPSRFLDVAVEEKNRDTTKRAIDVASRKHFTYVRYWAGRGEPSKLYRKTERRIKKIYTSLPVGALLVVLLLPSHDGSSHDQQQNAVCCATLRKECPSTISGQAEDGE